MIRICLQCRRTGFNPWLGKIPWKREWLPTPVFLPAEFHGLRILAGYIVHEVAESWTRLRDKHIHTFQLEEAGFLFVFLFLPGDNEPAKKSQSLLTGTVDRILGGNTGAHTCRGIHNFNNCYQNSS